MFTDQMYPSVLGQNGRPPPLGAFLTYRRC